MLQARWGPAGCRWHCCCCCCSCCCCQRPREGGGGRGLAQVPHPPGVLPGRTETEAYCGSFRQKEALARPHRSFRRGRPRRHRRRHSLVGARSLDNKGQVSTLQTSPRRADRVAFGVGRTRMNRWLAKVVGPGLARACYKARGTVPRRRCSRGKAAGSTPAESQRRIPSEGGTRQEPGAGVRKAKAGRRAGARRRHRPRRPLAGHTEMA
mmetsp:Transcript_63297/g.133505  ORF Transcript_63297/g.133505 Transcript_63297/m.133505 type:complete len:209 (-) Transcript_63297:95-721(-)